MALNKAGTRPCFFLGISLSDHIKVHARKDGVIDEDRRAVEMEGEGERDKISQCGGSGKETYNNALEKEGAQRIR